MKKYRLTIEKSGDNIDTITYDIEVETRVKPKVGETRRHLISNICHTVIKVQEI